MRLCFNAKRAGFRLAMLLTLILATGCGTFYTGQQSKRSLNWTTQERYDLGIIELDDQGWLYDREDAERVLTEVRNVSDKGPANVVVFVHGWHHNADPCNCNLQSFRRVLEVIDEQSQMPWFRQARELTGDQPARVVGVYVGWRGRSLPSFLDYATFWDRRPAAIRVGHGDLPGVLSRLQKIYDDGNKRNDHYTGLVAMGHSFGGQVLFAAISDLLKSRVAAALPLHGSSPEATTEIAGFGDLVILVNPALEASVYHSLDAMTRRAKFTARQSPVMIVVSSEGDWPNQHLFPIGRTFSVRHEPEGPREQLPQKIRTVGWYRPQVTHCLHEENGPKCYEDYAGSGKKPPAPDRTPGCECPDADRITFESSAVVRESESLDPRWLQVPEVIQLAKEQNAAGMSFVPFQPAVDPNNPFVVVKTTRDLSGDHNDMFNPRLVGFLVRYASGTQLKRLLVRRQMIVTPAPR